MDRVIERHTGEQGQPAGLGKDPLLCPMPTMSQQSLPPGQNASP